MAKINVSNNLKDRLTTLESSFNTETRNTIAGLLSDNYRLVWSSKGSSINRAWGEGAKGQQIDLYETGRLYRDMVGLTYVNITPSYISISAGQAYTSYLQDRYPFMNLSNQTAAAIAKAYVQPVRIALAG